MLCLWGAWAIWHVTAPVSHLSHRVVAMAPLRAVQDPGNQATEEDVDEGGRFALEG